MWQYSGNKRPSFAETPATGQESVWDYPRPPALRLDTRKVLVCLGKIEIAESNATYRILETASPPTFYIPPKDVCMGLLVDGKGKSFCEWKGTARYWSLMLAGRFIENIAWGYEQPNSAFSTIAGCLSFYPGLVKCFVDGERVRPQPGGFYGGWLTDEIAGPVKGLPGTSNW
ncbi:uncharacterized protein METZ01_LOCUS502264 [marine metagenome]|uniref:DUF427 domain-containing protein n=1 Tax=marine metagenome TaxID=408172 RepID=A0A383DYY8_9ZZZZ